MSVAWLAVITAGLLLPAAAGSAAPSGSTTAPANLGMIHKWVDVTYHAGYAPTARQAYGMAYDPNLGAVVLFGGNTASGGALGDTWEFVSHHWKFLNLNASASPPARWAEGLVYDPFMGGVLLFGGQNSFVAGCSNPCPYAFNDTWLFNSTGWHNLSLTNAPPAQPASTLVFDSHDGYDLLVSRPLGNPTYTEEWRFTGGKWVNATATIRGVLPNLGFLAADDAYAGFVLLFGGDSGCTGAGLTWEFRNGTFHNATSRQTVTPTATMGSRAITYDPRVRGVVMTGGYDNSCNVTNQTWMFNNGHWQDISNRTGTAIPGRWDARMVWDPYAGAHGGDLTFSGNEALVGGSNSFGTDTWRL